MCMQVPVMPVGGNEMHLRVYGSSMFEAEVLLYFLEISPQRDLQ